MANAKVSIIIPSFNTGKYISQCLDSVVNQTLKDIEIICIDNHSTDNTLNILKEYAKRDSRIKIISFNENNGAAASRNIGIENATGEYIGFVDSDDYIHLEMFEKLYDAAISKDLDMCMCKISTFEDGTGVLNDDIWYFALNCFNQLKKEVFNHHDTKEFMGEISVTVYNKIYRASMIRKNQIRFPMTPVFEDEVFFYDTYLHSQRVSVIPHNLYYYRTNREGSIVQQTADKDYSPVVEVFKTIRNIFIKTNNYEEYKCILCNIFIPMEIWRYGLSSKKYHESFFKDMKADCLELFEDKEILENLPIHIVDRVDNLINSSDWVEFDKKENFKDISVILTCYNDEKTIEKSILSVINQDLDFKKHVQCIIVDDGSEDKTKDICEKYIDLYPNNIVYIHQKHQGKSNAINLGTRYTKGKYYYYLDGNEEIKPQELLKLFNG
ncbi:glycosyltransferase family 2 protein [Methanobrevibacter sp.]|uniref:glycosyltransferase family 2 protein n=1 Tax=Methanobrevibacter sp. TaxID=66852 RepID=UPI00388EE1D1